MTVDQGAHVTIPVPDLETRTAGLEHLAEQVNDDPEAWPEPGVVTLLLTVWAHPSLRGETLQQAFGDYREQITTLLGAQLGDIHWTEIEPGLMGPDRQEQACEIQQEIVADALNRLLHGRA